MMTDAFVGRIQVSGTVEDESGSAIKGVQMRRAVAFADRGTETTTNVDGTFAFDCTNCANVEVTFSKGGYDAVSREFSIANDPTDPDSTGSFISQTNVRITLRKCNTGPELPGIEAFLECSEKGWWRVLPVRVGAEAFTVTNLSDVARLSNGQPCVYVMCDTNAAGRLNLDAQGRAMNPRVCIVGAGANGFCRMDGEGDAAVNLVSATDSAPAAGSYMKEMPVSQAGDQAFCLTVKSGAGGNIYGKGILWSGMVEGEKYRSFRCMVQILLQTNGTRNVRGTFSGFL